MYIFASFFFTNFSDNWFTIIIIYGILVESGQVTPRSFIETDKRPGVHGAMNLGSSGYAWDAIYSKTGITTTSDKDTHLKQSLRFLIRFFSRKYL